MAHGERAANVSRRAWKLCGCWYCMKGSGSTRGKYERRIAEREIRRELDRQDSFIDDQLWLHFGV